MAEKIMSLRQIADVMGIGEYPQEMEAFYEALEPGVPAADLALIRQLQEEYNLFDVYYDTDYLRYIPESCEATALLDGAYWAANSPIEGEVRMSFASGASVGITAGGALLR